MSNPFFTTNPADANIINVGLNSTGQYIVAVSSDDSVYTSSDYGNSFTNTASIIQPSSNVNNCVCSSANGEYFSIAATTGVYVSSDYGQSWVLKSGSPIFNSLVSNNTGTLLIGCDGTNIHISGDLGNNWTSFTPNVSISIINGSSSNLVGIGSDNFIYKTSNHGIFWSLINNTDTFNSAAISADGQTIYAAAGNQHPSSLQFSLDGGNTWSTISLSGWTYNVNCSNNGSTAVISNAIPNALGIYWTNDFGNTWTSEIYDSLNIDNWSFVNVSGNGLIGGAGDYGQSNIFTFSLTASPPVPPVPPINICLPKGTPIETDQGTFAIDHIADILDRTKIILTIDSNPIIAISQTLSTEKTLVCFEPNALGPNIPNKRTIVSRDHKVGYNGKLIQAKYFVKHSLQNKIYKVPHCSDDILYNVLLDDYSVMKVNNLSVETLHPQNPIAVILRNSKKQNQKRIRTKKVTNKIC